MTQLKIALSTTAAAMLLVAGCTGESEQPAKPSNQPQEVPTTSSSVPTQAIPETLGRFTVSGKAADAWTAGPDNQIALHPLGIEISSRSTDPASGGMTGGVRVRVSDDFERTASGGRIRVSVSARAAEVNGTDGFAVAYSTNEVGNSGWRTFEVSDSLQTYSFDFSVAPMKQGRGDFVGVWADTQGAGKALVIASLTVEVLAQQEGASPAK
jgi:hypothetical protein